MWQRRKEQKGVRLIHRALAVPNSDECASNSIEEMLKIEVGAPPPEVRRTIKCLDHAAPPSETTKLPVPVPVPVIVGAAHLNLALPVHGTPLGVHSLTKIMV